MADGIQMQPTNGRPVSPSKRRPEGREGLLAQKPPPLDSQGGRRAGLRSCCMLTPFLTIIGLALLLIGVIMYGVEGKAAGSSTDDMLNAALGPTSSSNSMVGHARYSYHAAYVSTVVIGACILAFTVGILIWRLFQLRSVGGGRGPGSHAQYMTLESFTHALGFILYVFCAWVMIWFAINILILAGVYIAFTVSHYADSGFGTTLVPLLNDWLTKANFSYQDLNELLGEVPAIGSQASFFTQKAFGQLVPTPPAIASYLNNATGGQFSYLIDSLLLNSGGIPGQCSANGCVDLSKYPFMNSNSCICDSPVLGQIASTAGGAVHHYIIAIIGLFIAYLGGSLLLSRLSAEAAKIHYDSNLLWTNKLDRLAMMRRNQNDAANQVGMSQRTGNGSVGGNSHYVI